MKMKRKMKRKEKQIMQQADFNELPVDCKIRVKSLDKSEDTPIITNFTTDSTSISPKDLKNMTLPDIGIGHSLSGVIVRVNDNT